MVSRWRGGRGDDGETGASARWRALAQLSLALRPSADPVELARAVASAISGIAGFSAVTIWLPSEDPAFLTLAASEGIAADDLDRLSTYRLSWGQLLAFAPPTDAAVADLVFHLRADHLGLVTDITRQREAQSASQAKGEALTAQDTLLALLRVGQGAVPVGLITLDGPIDPAIWRGKERALTCEIVATVAMALAATLTDAWAMRRATQLQQSIESGATEIVLQMDQASKGDFTTRAPVAATFLGAIADIFNEMLAHINATLVQARGSSQLVSERAVVVGALANSSMSDAAIQANLIARVSTSITNIAAAMRAIADQSGDASAAATAAREVSATGRQALEEAVAGMLRVRDSTLLITQRMKRLAESLQEIEGIARNSASFTDRLNALAINATIEAGRAGDRGRGVAAIANEITMIANNTIDAMRQLGARINAIQAQAGQVVTAIAEGTERVVEQSEYMSAAGAALVVIDEQSDEIMKLSGTIYELATEEAGVTAALESYMADISQITGTTRDGVRLIAEAMTSLAAEVAAFDRQLRQFTLDDPSTTANDR